MLDLGLGHDSRRSRTAGARDARGRDRVVLARRVADAVLPVPDEAAEAALLSWLAGAERPVVVSFANQQALNLACAVPGYAEMLEGADLLLRDGVGMRLCMAALGRSPGRNMNGTDLIPRILETFAGRRIAIYGTADPWISRAALVLERMGVNVVAVRDGFRHDSHYVADVLRNKPELVILAMGMPKQERVAAAIAKAAQDPIVIVNGGAIADFIGGRFPRAPEWMRLCGLEWLFRLGLEPLRLWRRYLLGGLAFGWRVARLWASSDAEPATQDMI